jgi:hypothetical protein
MLILVYIRAWGFELGLDTDWNRVSGVVGENSFKFFIQFVFYTAIYCFFLLAVMANYLHEQLTTPVSIYFDHDHRWAF